MIHPLCKASISPDGCILLSVGDSPQVYLYGMTGGARITFTQLALPPFTSPPSVHHYIQSAHSPRHSVPRSLQVPFIIRSTLSITDHPVRPSSHPFHQSSPHLTFFLSFTPQEYSNSRSSCALDDVAVGLYLGTGASSATCGQATGSSEWMYVSVRRTLCWSLPPAPAQSSGWRGTSAVATVTLRGTFASTDVHLRPGSGGNDDSCSDSDDGAATAARAAAAGGRT
jgi:hypothetical protein